MKCSFLPLVLASLFVFAGCSSADTPAPAPAPAPPADTLQTVAAPEEMKAFFAHLKAGQKQTVVVYGTSLTEFGGWGDSLKNWFDKRFPGQVKFVNSGLAGKNSDEGVTQLKAKVLDRSPDLVFLEFSINDSRQSFHTSKEKSTSNLNRMVEAIRAKNPQSAIVLQVMNPTWDAPNGKGSASIRPQYDAYNDLYRAYARDHKLPLIDHWANWRKIQETDLDKFHTMIPDGTHPSTEASIAVTWPLIRTTLEAVADAP